ncbi:iron-containing alcohol dehydrogenase, partial [Synergistaceae bacterium OttesenSCG-928-I11]|nr:iron-containing alcohol dehydrogenase [Synergistaceae bacterium OttesenSCG-928-I11]
MSALPKNMDEFVHTPDWWRTSILTEIIKSKDGVGDILKGLEERNKKAFFIVDAVLESQKEFERIFGQKDKFAFDASESEPRTGDVDKLVAMIKEKGSMPDVIAGIGGGSTMDLAKAVAICTANPEPAATYQGYGLDMKRGADIWVLPTLPGTGAEVTPIAVLRGPEKKLGINNNFTASAVAVIDPQLSVGVKKFNRFYTMMDCFFHHFEITQSKTSAPCAIEDAWDGRRMATEVLTQGAGEYDEARAIESAMASVLGGSSTIGGRVGVSHAISYGLSNSAPKLPHSVAVTISMLACKDVYKEGGYDETVKFLELNGMPHPRARDYGIDDTQLDKMTKTALGMEKLWQSHFGDDWKKFVDYA